MLLAISIAVRVVAFFWSVMLLRRLRDWRIGFLSLMLAFMTFRQMAALVIAWQNGNAWGIDPAASIAELPGLAVSIMALLAVLFLQGVILQQRATAAVQRSIMQSSPDYILLLDAEAKIQFINRTRPEFTVDEVVGTSMLDYLPSDHRDRVKDCLNRVRASLTPDLYETEFHGADGTVQSFESRVSPVIEDGQLTGFVVVASDISHRKATEQKLHENQLRLQDQFAELELLYQSAPVGLCLMNTELELVRINDQLARLNGLPASEYIGKPLADVVPDIVARVEPVCRNVIETGKPAFNIEVDRPYALDRSDIHSYLANFHPLRDHDGRIRGLSVVVQDITERKRAEQATRIRNHAIANAVVPIILADVDGELTYVNQATADLWGYDGPGEMVNQPLAIMSSSAADVAPVMDGLRDDGRWIGERLARRKDGSTFPVLVSASVILDLSEKPLCLMASIIDLTKVKRTMTDLKYSRERLADVTRALITAHESERRKLSRELHDELGQVLTSVNFGLARIKPKIDAELHPLIEESEAAVTVAINQVRNLSTNLLPSVLDDFGLIAAVEWLVERIRRQSSFEFQLDLDDFNLSGDFAVAAFRFVQEAVTNAMRHAQASCCWITIKREDEGIRMVVRDNGKGFNAQADAGGAGLSNMRERIELIGGRFSLATAQGRGTTVSAWLPCAIAEVV